MLVVGSVMAVRQIRARRVGSAADQPPRSRVDDPIISFSPAFACQCPRALKVLVTATAVGLLTGFLGVCGGFLVVPALLLALAPPMEYAVGTSRWSSRSPALSPSPSGPAPASRPAAVWSSSSPSPQPPAASVGAASRSGPTPDSLSAAFTVLVLAVAGHTSARALPALS